MKIDGSFYHDWDSFIFWHGMNWRNFSFISLSFELMPHNELTIRFALIGFHFEVWIRSTKFDKEMEDDRNDFFKKLKDNNGIQE